MHTHFPLIILANIYWAPILYQAWHPQPLVMNHPDEQTTEDSELPDLHSLEDEKATDASSQKTVWRVTQQGHRA